MQRNFFALDVDLLSILEQVERKHSIKYCAAGLFASATPMQVELGAALSAGEHCNGAGYLVTPAAFEVRVRPVPQREGGTLYAIDELENPSGITLRPGGFVGKNVLLPGVVGTSSNDGPAVVLHRAFVSAIGKHFKRVQSYWVGPGAFELLGHGARLTVSVKAPREYDLALVAEHDV
jgi:hypothetical protein